MNDLETKNCIESQMPKNDFSDDNEKTPIILGFVYKEPACEKGLPCNECGRCEH